MSKTVPAATNNTDTTTTLARLWEVTRRDNTVFRFTDHDVAITYGGQSYSPSIGYGSSAIKDASDNSVDTGEITALIDSNNITREDVEAGLFNNAEVLIYTVNYLDADNGDVKEKRGFLGNVDIVDDSFTVEFRGMHQIMQQPIGRRYSSLCTAVLGDTECKVRLDPPDWEASTAYTVNSDNDAGSGSVVQPTTLSNDLHMKCTVAGTSDASEPTWPTVVGGTVVDNGVTWEAIQALNYKSVLATPANSFRYWRIVFNSTTGSHLNLDQINFRAIQGGALIQDFISVTVDRDLSSTGWNETSASLEDMLDPTNDNPISYNDTQLPRHIAFDFGSSIAISDYFIKTVLSVSSQPDDFDLEGSNDGTIWTSVESRIGQAGTFAATEYQNEYSVAGTTTPSLRYWLEVDGLDDFPDNWFDGGTVAFTSGNLDGISLEIKTQIGTKVFTFDYFAYDPTAGASVTLTAGCSKDKADCRDKFNNIYNVRAFFNIPGTDKATRYPNANG